MSKRSAASASISRRSLLFAGLAAALLVPGSRAEAQTARQLRRRKRKWRRAERKRLRDAIRRGQAKPLFQVMRRFQRRVGGEVLDVRYREPGPHRVYVFVVLFDDGRIARLVVDARTEQIFTLEEAKRHYGISGQD